jgi:hypothetical protein
MRFPIKITENFILEPIMHTFGVKAETSYVEISGGSLEVRMGIWFHETFPLDQIGKIAPSDWPWWGGLGVKLHHHGVGVVGSTEGVVNVQLKGPQKVRAVLEVEATQLWISVENHEAFLNALSEATHLPVSEHVKF